MTDTTNLALPCIEASQAQKHVTHNDALRILDTLVQLAVLTRTLSTPPASPSDGQRWIVKAAGADAWAGHDNAVAAWQDGAWQFSTPQTGWIAFVVDEGTLLVWNGTTWGDFFSTVSSIQNLALLGVGTTADTTNVLAAKLNHALFTARTAAEGGDGNLRYTLNKETAADTLSFLFQDGYSGRAEIGLTGDDDFYFKVSPDGATWYEGILVSRTTGAVTFPNTSTREVLAANRTYYVRTDGSDANTGLVNSSGGAFATLQKAWNVACGLDLHGYSVTIQVADGTYSAGINTSLAPVGGIVTVQGNTTTPDNCVISTSSVSPFDFEGLGTYVRLQGFKTIAAGHWHIATQTAGVRIDFGHWDFGDCTGSYHLYCDGQSVIYASGPITVSGNATAFLFASRWAYCNFPVAFTFVGTPTFSNFIWLFSTAQLDLWGFSYGGSISGAKYSIGPLSIINVSSSLPGSTGGVDSLGKAN